MKLISFAVPCYNSAEYMEKCIESLLKAGEDAEIIIVNDGSTKDNTKEIADRYQEKYPSIVKAIHQENGGHGQAVNTGLKNATGKYFKVVDSDDWVDESALNEVMSTLRSMEEEIDVYLVNYVYEYLYNNTQKHVNYRMSFPVGRKFNFEESKKLPVGTFIAMHSVIYRTGLLREINLELPKHTFYVDNLFVFTPLPYAKSFYYINVDFYRYFIGRQDQSVNESVIMKRIDQHIKVTELLLEAHDINTFKETRKRLYKYSLDYLMIMMIINSIYLIKIGDKESFDKKRKLWDKLKEKDPVTYKKLKRKFTGMVASDSKFKCGLAKKIYVIVRKIFKFN